MDSELSAKLNETNISQPILVQTFASGRILRDSDGAANGLAYIFLNDGAYIRDSY